MSRKQIEIRIPPPTERQKEFFACKNAFVAYGGARGGGKSWAARVKAVLLAFHYPGIQILLLRRTLAELRENHVIPLLQLLQGAAFYREQSKEFSFPNGSRIKLGYCKREADVLQYQGQAYDVIFLEEATQFTEFQFQSFTEISRSSGLCKASFEPRMYFTCNPGGVGHGWVKRLFITRSYQGTERAEDYAFIPAKVYDNPYILKNSPGYVRKLENLPPERRKAMLLGDWDIYEGQYFSEFRREIHVMRPFVIPKEWRRYRTMDYGLDMLACYWVAMDPQGRAYVYRELYEPGLVISDAAEKIAELSEEPVDGTFAPPDLWNRRQDTGQSVADIFGERGIWLTKATNDLVHGWLALHEWLKPGVDETGTPAAGLRIFESCRNLISCLPALCYDPKNPNDCANEPHEITHGPDAIRYFVAGRPAPTVIPREPEEGYVSYDQGMKNFLSFGG